MNNREQVRKFEYRPYRMRSGFAVEFSVGDETLHGLCRDVSDAGIRAEFERPVIVGDTGLLVLLHASGQLKLKAKAAYVETRQVGLVFLFQSPWEQQVTSEYVASIANHTDDSLLIQFP